MMHNKSMMIRCYRIVKVKKYLYFTNTPKPTNNNRNYTSNENTNDNSNYDLFILCYYNL